MFTFVDRVWCVRAKTDEEFNGWKYHLNNACRNARAESDDEYGSDGQTRVDHVARGKSTRRASDLKEKPEARLPSEAEGGGSSLRKTPSIAETRHWTSQNATDLLGDESDSDEEDEEDEEVQ
jgi:hypothetical protein